MRTDIKKKYVLQKINHHVFKDIDGLMNNIAYITEFLEDNNIETLRIIKTKDGKLYTEYDNEFYRVYDKERHALTYEKVDNLEMVYNLAKAFAMLHKNLSKFDASKLVEVIPNFHNTVVRYQNFLDAVNEDKLGRKATCLEEIEAIKSFEKEYGKIVDGIKNNEINLSVTHNDPKINNVMFDKYTGEIRCVIDLDTIMPGSYLYDVGDALRSLFIGENEDNPDLSQIHIDKDIFKAYVSGYLSEMKKVLTKKEIELISFSSFLLTIECGMRFLEDYLRGDVYFQTTYPTHNLIRARTQIKQASMIYACLDDLNKIVKDLL